jgi:hypothetical protein
MITNGVVRIESEKFRLIISFPFQYVTTLFISHCAALSKITLLFSYLSSRHFSSPAREAPPHFNICVPHCVLGDAARI